MLNGGPLNGSALNGLSDSPATLTAEGTLPALTGEGYLFISEPNGASNGILPALTGEGYFGAVVRGTLPALTGTGTLTAQTLLRGTGTLPALTGEANLSAEQYLSAVGTLPALTGEGYSGAVAAGTLPKLTGTGTLTAETLLRAVGVLPKLTGEGEFSSPTTLRAIGVLPALQSQYGIAKGTLPALTGTGRMTAAQVRTLIAYALNLANNAMTPYSNYNFQHIVRFKGHSYGFDSSGGYLLEGDDDNGTDIDASMTLPDFDYGISNIKNVPYVYVGTKSENIQVTAIVDEDALSPMVETASPLGTNRNKRAKFGRGAQGVMWRHSLSNVNGGPMDIDSIEIHPDIKKRRIG